VNDSTPTERELQALKILWHHGDATVRQVCDAESRDDRSTEVGHDKDLREIYRISSASQLEQLWKDRAVKAVLAAS
jgi:hypothetical protein